MLLAISSTNMIPQLRTPMYSLPLPSPYLCPLSNSIYFKLYLFQRKVVKVDGEEMIVEIFDTGVCDYVGSNFADQVLAQSDYIIFAFSICDRNSFVQLKEYFQRACRHCEVDEPSALHAALLATKCDLEDKREVFRDEYRELANTHSLPLFEVSSLEDVNVGDCFEMALRRFRAEHRVD